MGYGGAEGGARFGYFLFSRRPLLTILCYCSLSLHPDYNKFRTGLEESLKNDQTNSNDYLINAALAVLRGKNFRYKRGNGPPATGQDTKMLRCAFKVLLENAIEEFGYAPRDVYSGVFDLPSTRAERNEAVCGANYSALAEFATQFSWDCHLNSRSDMLIIVKPMKYLPNMDGWDIDFKSAYVLEKVMASAQSKHDGYLWRVHHTFKGDSASSTLAGYLFEAIVHRLFAHGWKDIPHKPIPMVSDLNTLPTSPPNLKKSPTFSSDAVSTPAWVPLLPPLFADGSMDTAIVDFTSEGLNVTLDSNKYYKPGVTNNALFDLFTVGRDLQGAFLISVFKITVSESCGGSTDGYKHIRKIMQCVKTQLQDQQEPETEVKVGYFLLCPEDGSRQWNMPPKWDTNVILNDHRGEVYCVRVCVPGTLCLFFNLSEPRLHLYT